MEPLPTAPNRKIAVVGLGYVGLPVAVSFSRHFPGTVGFDISADRIRQLQKHIDVTNEITAEDLASSNLRFTTDPTVLADADFIIVTVPTPIDFDRRPDLGPLRAASTTVGRHLKRGAIVVYESTVYPGVTEEVCGPILAAESGLQCGVDFTLGYSPERINPGDREHSFDRITKVVSAQDAATLQIVADCYGAVVKAGIHRAPSIKVAEAAKVIENTQRDLNIALINELAMIFNRLGIDTRDVLAAAGTKWNFLPFTPGLVGGHCIGVDPYYLTALAERVGINPQVILAGRKTNDSMGAYVAQQTVKALIAQDRAVKGARVAVLGITFKENVPDIRNSQVPNIVSELRDYGVEAQVYDPMSTSEQVEHEYGFPLVDKQTLRGADAVIVAVAHRGIEELAESLLTEPNTVVCVDVKGLLNRGNIPAHVRHWRL